MKSSFTHFLIAAAVLVACIAGYAVWYSVIAGKSRAVADLEQQISDASENVGNVASVRTALAEIAGDETKIRSYFVPEEGVVAFINDLESRGTAQKTTATVLSVATGGTPARPTLLLALSVKGTFDAVMRTVGSIEYAPYDISVSAFSIKQEGKGAWSAVINLTVGSVSAKSKAINL
ncbi:MAG: hypothetical protein WCT45_03555 [Candidatus Paceibacterota bacterium]|jgi:hypothetical protein